MSIRTWLISSFREIFLYHYRSLEFRAKIFALIIAAGTNEKKEYSLERLKEVASEIYVDDKKRQEVLIRTTKEYICKILNNPRFGFDDFVKDVDLNVKIKKELIDKINLDHIKRFVKDDISEDKKILQLRVYEFFEGLAGKK
ncbi:MAG: hypothetical protein LBG67_04360 [Campylobacteraceae bacterium]|nr:hypothetical protein [Campylobacteraceae bacterium]